MKVAIITANTDIYKEKEEDLGGKAIQEIVTEAGLEVVFMRALPVDRQVLSTVMQRLSDNGLADLVLVTGGSGCGPQDCTPEATADVADRMVPGIGEAIRYHTMKLSKRAMLNRSTAAIRKETLIVDLPGKEVAVRDSLSYVLPELVHVVKLLKGEA